MHACVHTTLFLWISPGADQFLDIGCMASEYWLYPTTKMYCVLSGVNLGDSSRNFEQPLGSGVQTCKGIYRYAVDGHIVSRHAACHDIPLHTHRASPSPGWPGDI